MKKKGFLFCLALALISAAFAVTLAACDDEELACTHDEKVLVEVELAPTCVAKGKALYECYNCHERFEEELAINPQGHNWDEASEVREEFCDKPGSLTHTCLNCHETFTESLDATGHNLKSVITKQATCTTPGEEKYSCANCGYSYVKSIKAKGHTPGKMIIVEEATCLQPGRKESRCESCGEICDMEAIEAKGHTEAQPVVTKPANCVEKGEKTVNCAECGAFIRKIEISPLGHKPVEISPEETPTCQKAGHTAGSKCDVCGILLEAQRPIEKVDHSYKMGKCIWCDDEKQYIATFNAFGQLVEKKSFTVSTAKDVVPPKIPSKTGYTNLRWEQYTLTYEDITINALYDLEQYAIIYEETYDAPNANPQSYNIESGEILLESLERPGYNFLGWFEDGQKKNRIESGMHGDRTFTAKWEKAVYHITYVGCDDFDTQSFPSEYSIDSPAIELPKIERVGYKFDGWSVNGEIKTHIATGSYGDITLTAKFTPYKYDITMDAKGGTLNAYGDVVNFGEKYTLEVPTRRGYEFLGWFDSAEDEAKQLTDNKGASFDEYDCVGNLKVYAHWKICTYIVTFETGGGSDVEPQTYEFNQRFVLPDEPKQKNFFFAGWYDESGEVEYNSNTFITDNVTMHAKWVESVEIATPDDLRKIEEHPNKTYHLANDIDMRGVIWTPIPEFSGTLNGRGYKIYNFLLSTTSPGENFGLIAVNNGTIKDLVISDFTFSVTASSVVTNAGVLVGMNGESGVIQNVKATSSEEMSKLYFSSYSGSNRTVTTGCIAGRNKGIMSYCSVQELSFSVKGDGEGKDTIFYCYGGLIVGYNSGRINNSSATGDMTYFGHSYSYYILYDAYDYGLIGMVAGGNDKTGVIDECNSAGEISSSYKVDSDGHCLGRIGALVGKNDGVVRNSFSSGKITGGLPEDSCTGGLVGYNEKGGSIESCYSSVILETTHDNHIGGLVGCNRSVVQNCYATGNVTTAANANVGGLVGYNTSTATVTKCFAINNITLTGANGTAGYLVGNNEGVLSGSYYTQGNIITINNKYVDTPSDQKDVFPVTITQLWTEEFLYGVLYWEQAGWTYLIDENPRLNWEFTAVHNFVTQVIKPDCTHGGYTMYSCVDCGTIFVMDYVEPKGHSYHTEHKIPAGCTTEGYTLKKCDVCQEEFKDEIVNPTGHPREKMQLKTQQEGMATCTDDGFLVYHCDECNNDVTVPQAALGHNGSFVRRETEPSCSQEGRDIYHCETCSQDYSVVVPRTEHQFIDIEYLAPTCGIVRTSDGHIDRENCKPQDGHHAGSKCSVCGFVQYGCEVIPAHNYEHQSYEKTPTCTEEGVEILKCRDCELEFRDEHAPMIAHQDKNKDFQCDVCKKLMFTDAQLASFTHITDVAGLLNIMKNPNSNYWLDNDIVIGEEVVWVPIGTQKMPFKGIFFGADHKISGLKFDIKNNTEISVCGLFGYNSGKIFNLKLSGVQLNTHNADVVFGGIAAYNRGEVRNCELIDVSNIFAGVELVVSTYMRDKLKLSGSTIGGMVGVNEGPMSLIEDCTVSGTLNVKFSNISEVKAAKASDTLWSLIFETRATTEQRVTFGGLVGVNQGKVNKCSVNGQTTINMNIIAKLSYMRGETYATSYLYCGSFVGYNSGSVIACKARAATVNYNQKILTERLKGLLYVVDFALYNYSMSDGVANIEGGADKNAIFECEELK